MPQAIATWATTQSEEDAMNDDHAPLWAQMIALAAADAPTGKAVLDFGCNQGGFLAMLYNRFPYREALGVDLATNSLAVARQRLQGIPVTFDTPGILAEQTDRFDMAFSHEVLYLLPDMPAHAAQIKKVLKPGGVYFAAIGCHTDQPLWPAWKELIGGYSSVAVQDYSLDDYAAAFFNEGFRVAVQPYRTEGFFPLKQGNSYFPTVKDTLRYYQSDKVLFRFEKEA